MCLNNNACSNTSNNVCDTRLVAGSNKNAICEIIDEEWALMIGNKLTLSCVSEIDNKKNSTCYMESWIAEPSRTPMQVIYCRIDECNMYNVKKMGPNGNYIIDSRTNW